MIGIDVLGFSSFCNSADFVDLPASDALGLHFPFDVPVDIPVHLVDADSSCGLDSTGDGHVEVVVAFVATLLFLLPGAPHRLGHTPRLFGAERLSPLGILLAFQPCSLLLTFLSLLEYGVVAEDLPDLRAVLAATLFEGGFLLVSGDIRFVVELLSTKFLILGIPECCIPALVLS